MPTRFTYITFGHLTTFDELKATYAYQGRTDLLLHPLPGTPVEEIVNGVRDPEWVAAHAAGRPSMGRRDARFADWCIGVCSQWAQLWVDRNFALDYTLKSLEKILDGDARRQVRADARLPGAGAHPLRRHARSAPLRH